MIDLDKNTDEYMEISGLEKWEDIEDGKYQKSSLGRIRDKETKTII